VYREERTRVHLGRALDLDKPVSPPIASLNEPTGTPPSTPENGKEVTLTPEEKSISEKSMTANQEVVGTSEGTVSIPPDAPALEPSKCPQQRCVSKEQVALERQKQLEYYQNRREKRKAARERRRQRMTTPSGYVIDEAKTARRRRARQRKKAQERGEYSDSDYDDSAPETDGERERFIDQWVIDYIRGHPGSTEPNEILEAMANQSHESCRGERKAKIRPRTSLERRWLHLWL